jgi:hypothetical protein
MTHKVNGTAIATTLVVKAPPKESIILMEEKKKNRGLYIYEPLFPIPARFTTH